jgi:putative endonuclease
MPIQGVLLMRSEWKFWVYILSSVSGTLYVGVTNNIDKRMWEHKSGLIEGFSKKYKCTRLVYYETFDDVRVAISREKQVKRWRREKKVYLIENVNPHWNDLSENWGSRMVFPKESIRELREKAEGSNQGN